MKKSLCTMLIVCLFCFQFFASPAKAIDNDFQLWLPIYFQKTFKEKFLLYVEANPRLADNVTDFGELRLRPALGYKIRDNLIFYQGYAWAPRFFRGFRNENRIWQQIQVHNKFKRLNIINYLRLEERFIENTGSPALRARYTFELQYPFDQKEIWKLIFQEKFYYSFYNVARGPEIGGDQNRLYAGIRKKINDNIDFETGYQLQHLFENGRPDNRFIHSVVTSLFLNY